MVREWQILEDTLEHGAKKMIRRLLRFLRRKRKPRIISFDRSDFGFVHDAALDPRREWHDQSGECHRADGPAVECPDGTKAWYRHGKLHREDGPAVERPVWYAPLYYWNGQEMGKATYFKIGHYYLDGYEVPESWRKHVGFMRKSP